MTQNHFWFGIYLKSKAYSTEREAFQLCLNKISALVLFVVVSNVYALTLTSVGSSPVIKWQ